MSTYHISVSHFDWEENLRAENHIYKQTTALYLVSDTCDISDFIALTNTVVERDEIYRWSFESSSTKFRTDNCATHHIFSQEELLISMSKSSAHIGVKGIVGSTIVEGIGTIQFMSDDDINTKYIIKQDNVI